ncbi:MAG TPA: aspartate racemase [Firmicutes bacterium]|nr:aspartate racemase [Bacillota bacterium]
MKTIGLIGGMSWESTALYYQFINEAIKERRGGFHSAKSILYSVDFEEIESCQRNGDWNQAGEILNNAAHGLEKAGADFIIICTNTMHKVFDDIRKDLQIPVLHIADATAEEIQSRKIKKVGLLGTQYTMEQDFYKARLHQNGIEVLVPPVNDRKKINEVIYQELCLGKVRSVSKQEYQRIIHELQFQGAEGIVLGCTEIGLLIKQTDAKVPLFDTTYIHAMKAVEYALK